MFKSGFNFGAQSSTDPMADSSISRLLLPAVSSGGAAAPRVGAVPSSSEYGGQFAVFASPAPALPAQALPPLITSSEFVQVNPPQSAANVQPFAPVFNPPPLAFGSGAAATMNPLTLVPATVGNPPQPAATTWPWPWQQLENAVCFSCLLGEVCAHGW